MVDGAIRAKIDRRDTTGEVISKNDAQQWIVLNFILRGTLKLVINPQRYNSILGNRLWWDGKAKTGKGKLIIIVS